MGGLGCLLSNQNYNIFKIAYYIYVIELEVTSRLVPGSLARGHRYDLSF